MAGGARGHSLGTLAEQLSRLGRPTQTGEKLPAQTSLQDAFLPHYTCVPFF